MPAAGQRSLHHRRCRSNTNVRTEQQHLLRQQPSSGGSLLLPTSTSTSPSRTVSRCHPPWQLLASTSSTPTPTTPAPTAAPSTRSTMPPAGQRSLHHHRCRSNTNARTEQQHLLRQQPSSGGSLLLPTSTSTSPSRTVSRCHPHLAAPSVNIIDADANYTGANRSTVTQIDDAARWAAIATSPPLPQQHERED